MKKTILLLGFFILLFAKCNDTNKTPKVSYDSNNKNKVAKVKIDSSKIQIADLPIQIKETKYLLHPIGDFVYEGGSWKYDSSSTSKENLSFSISNSNEYEITGYIQNLKFQHTDSTSIRSLTNNPVLIETITYLNKVAEKTNQQLLVYTMADNDTNGDGKVNSNDIKSLYISKVSGLNFRKLTSEFQELIDWNVIESNNKLYFRTIEDTNKNGQFDDQDKLHYQFVDLNSKDKIAQEYKPI
jgi:hypothetical protein